MGLYSKRESGERPRRRCQKDVK